MSESYVCALRPRIEWRRPTSSGALVRSRATSSNGDDQRPLAGAILPIDGTNPAGMAFVLRQPCEFLPSEMARVHVFGLGLDDEARALAPWAIDEATDQLFSHRQRPADFANVARRRQPTWPLLGPSRLGALP